MRPLGGDGAAAFLIGTEDDGPVVAELLGSASATEEFVDRWRQPGSSSTGQWEERFGETRYGPLAAQAWKEALGAAGIEADDVDVAVVTGAHGRAVKRVAGQLGVARVADDLGASGGQHRHRSSWVDAGQRAGASRAGPDHRGGDAGRRGGGSDSADH